MTGRQGDGGRMEFALLGPLRVTDGDGRELPTGGPRDRRALAVLLLDAGRVVTVGRLARALWEEPPATAREQVFNVVGGLRRRFAAGTGGAAVGPERTGDDGFVLTVGRDGTDLGRFRGLVERATGDPERVATLLREALALWRGPALGGFGGPVLAAAAAQLEEERLSCLERRVEADLACGRHRELVDELAGLTTEHPLRERFTELALLALHRSGRRAEALELYARTRRTLAEELGLDPGAELTRLHRAVLADRPPGAASMPVPTPAPMPAGKGAREGAQEEGPDGVAFPVPAQLPADSQAFVDRPTAVRALLRALAADRRPEAVPVCLISGQAGAGKTALAVHVAHRRRAAYPDGQFFVDLRGADRRPADPGEVLAGFLRALGVDGRRLPGTTAERAALYRSLLADRRVLVLLDNAADEDQARPLLPGTPGSAVLLTSRRRLPGLDLRLSLPLGPLDDASAVALLAAVAGPERVGAEPEAARTLAGLCGHLPLAVRIVAAKLAAHPHRGLADLVDRLADERRRLDELTHGTLGVRAGLSLTHRTLSGPARALLRRTALLDAPDFAAWTAAAALGRPLAETEELLDALVATHLLEADRPAGARQARYRFHDLVRAFGRERAEAEEPPGEREAALGRVLRRWVTLVRAGRVAHQGSDYPARIGGSARSAAEVWCRRQELTDVGPGSAPRPAEEAVPAAVTADPVGWLGEEREALVATVRQAAGLPQGDEHASSCWELAALGEYLFDLRSDLAGWRTVQELGLTAARAAGDRRAEAALLVGLGRCRATHEEWDAARETLEEGAALFGELGDEHGRAYAGWVLSYLDRLQGRTAEATDRCRRGAEVFAAVGDLYGQAHALRGLGQVLLAEGRQEEALRLFREAMETAGRGGAVWPRMSMLRWVAEAHRLLGRHREAERDFAEVLAHTREDGDLAGQTAAHTGLGRVALDRGDLPGALRELRTAAAIGRRSGQTVMHALAVDPLAEALLAAGRPADARAVLDGPITDCRTMRTGPLLDRLLARREQARSEEDRCEAVRRVPAAGGE
ncbi:BTAD domain-containing putative transcriptional regulator [Kitasatospora sp. NPDC051853]|uniref:AfsR/SARP family transcriptional regulator n=1 Tax=Kitasatospora sp. NPDC051853 TaxID=3364058 RepID=UPI0037B9BD7D